MRKNKDARMEHTKRNKLRKISFLNSLTSIHGTNHLSMMQGYGSWLWFVLMTFIAILTFAFILTIKGRYNRDQVVTGISPYSKVSEACFPTISICNFNLVSKRESQNVIRILKSNKIRDSEIKEFLQALPYLVEPGVKSVYVPPFTKIMSILRSHYFTIKSFMEEIRQKCENLLLYCEFNQKPKQCKDIFVMIQTFAGHCCAFNYAAISDGSEEIIFSPLLPQDKDFEYYDQGVNSKVNKIIITGESGRTSGLRVLMNVEPNDYYSWYHIPAYGAMILLSDPNDYPETTVLYRYLVVGESLDMKVDPLIFRTDANLRRLSPETRLLTKHPEQTPSFITMFVSNPQLTRLGSNTAISANGGCWFQDDILLTHTDMYSYETCKTECKMRAFYELCGCIPYKYPSEKSTRVCEFVDLLCLNNVTVHWHQASSCKCQVECEDQLYRLTSDSVPFLPSYYPSHVTQNRNLDDLSSLQVYFINPSCNCYKTSLLIDFNVLIATYGGLFSLSFGASIITLFEIAYLLLNLLLRIVKRKYNKKFNRKSA